MKKWVKYSVQLIVGVVISLLIAWLRLPQMPEGKAGTIMAFSDGFSVCGLLWLSMGILLTITSTGFLDPLAFAFRRGVNAFLPNFHPYEGGFYEYKMEKKEKRKEFKEYSVIVIGAVLLIVSAILTAVWYQTV